MLSEQLRRGVKCLADVGFQSAPLVVEVLSHNRQMGSAVVVRVVEGERKGQQLTVQQNRLKQRAAAQ